MHFWFLELKNSIGVSKASTDQDMNSAATGISELEQMLKQKTFTRLVFLLVQSYIAIFTL